MASTCSCTVGAEVNTQESLSTTVTQRYDFKKRCKDTIKSTTAKILRIKTEYVQVSTEPVRGLKEVE